MRLSGDDYCYNAVLAQKGFWEMQPYSFYQVAMYNGNRYSANLLAGFFGLFPILGASLLITASLLAWLGGIVVLLRRLSRRFEIRLSWIELVVIAEAFISLVLWSAPSLSQSFFWRSGVLSYLSPLVGGIWVLVYVFAADRPQKLPWLHLFGIFSASIFVGGFSETGAAFWIVFWALFLFALLISKWFWKTEDLGWLAKRASAAFLGTLLAGVLLTFSPSTALRLAGSPVPQDLGKLIPLLALNVRVYLWINLMRRTWTILIPILLGLGLGIAFSIRQGQSANALNNSNNLKKFVGMLVLVGMSILLMLAGIMLPVTFIQSDYLPERAMILSQTVLTSGGILGGILIAVLVRGILRKLPLESDLFQKLLRRLSILLILTSLIAPTQLIRFGFENWPLFSRWSRLWDQRHARLIEAGRAGIDTLHVMVLDHPIEDVGELAGDPGYWYNNCAEIFYGVDEIIADQPGW